VSPRTVLYGVGVYSNEGEPGGRRNGNGIEHRARVGPRGTAEIESESNGREHR